MRGLFRAGVSRWMLSFIGVALLAALVWVFGPLQEGFEAPLPRLMVIQTLLAAWGAANGLLTWRQRSRDAWLTAGIAAAGEEADAVGDQLRDALALLKRSGRRDYLQQQPWYVIIGPPGAGKTTALLNAGLVFPLAEQLGFAAVSGVGGTRLCDWWFTDNAVLIDTAGRYTTQDSNAAIDSAGWEAFLALLKRTRPHQPLNGVIVAIALPSLVDAPAGEAAAHAAAVARRIAELEDRLGVRIPIYVLFTKADLIAGFSEFFDDLDTDARNQVWGTSFPFAPKLAPAAQEFTPAFRDLVARLVARVGQRLQDERRVERRGAIAGFPAQVASLEKPLAAFLAAAFAAGAPGRPAPLLRGVYFASGTQEGTPIDRLTGAMARAFGIDQRRAGAQRPEQGRSYFLGRLLREVMLGEAMLVREAPGTARRRLSVRIAAFAGVAVAVVVAAATLLAASAAARRDTKDAMTALAGYEQVARDMPLDPVSDGDLAQVAGLLDRAQVLARNREKPALLAGLGLWQGEKLAAGEHAVYRDALAYGLLPRLVWRLEARMRGSLNRPAELYEAMRIYLMLGAAGPVNPAQIRDWMAEDFHASYPTAEDAPLREALARHLDAALAEPLPPLSLDGALVAQMREVLGRVPVADRAYAAIRAAPTTARLVPWRPLDALGPAGAQIFLRSSGKSMADGIPGLYTADGFRKVVLPAIDAATRTAAGESWVLGSRAELGPAEFRALSGTIIARYTAEHQLVWDTMLADLNVRPLQSLVQAAQDLYVLASPESPLRALEASLAHELALGAGTSTEAHYRRLIDAAGGPAGAPIEAALRQMAEMQQTLAKLAALPVGAPIPAGGETIAAGLAAEAARQPQPVARWLSTIAASATALRTGNVRDQAAVAFNAPAGPAQTCQATVNGRYPFAAPSIRAELTLDDLARLFAPGGSLDGFFNLQLKPFVDMVSQTWKPQSAGTVQPPFTAADAQQFQRAAAIRDALFVGGQPQPAMQFEIQPISLDPGAASATLNLGGTVIGYNRKPSHATQVSWPGDGGAGLTFEPPGAEMVETGPWALFRLIAKGKLQPGKERGRSTLTFQSGGRQAVFDVRTGSASSAFTPGLLADFRCPSVR